MGYWKVVRAQVPTTGDPIVQLVAETSAIHGHTLIPRLTAHLPLSQACVRFTPRKSVVGAFFVFCGKRTHRLSGTGAA